MTLYHATSKHYTPGENLLSLRRLADDGILSDESVSALLGRWELDDSYLFADGELVSFTADRDEAEYILSEYNEGVGSLLALDTNRLAEEGIRLTTNAEGYPAVSGEVPAWLLSVVS